jgi:large subunit ribosomal protein L2
MPVKKIRPLTPGQRGRVALDLSSLSKNAPVKSLIVPFKKSGGRNHSGKMTIRYRGGGHKKRMRLIDFKRLRHGVPAVVKSIEYDPIRTAWIALLYYADGYKSYIIAPSKLKIGDSVLSSNEAIAPEIGNSLPLKFMPSGTLIHNIELSPGAGGVLVRSAGASAQLLAKGDKYVTVKMPSGEMRMVLGSCKATVGAVSNSDHMNVILGKAGRNRWLGSRPRVRGVAMNPVDHPMGGGEGKASGGHPRSRNGIYAKGQKTRKPKRYSDKFIINNSKKK